MKLSDKITKLRKANGWAQEELAEQLNVSRQAISRWENGTALPDANNILQLSKLFNVTTDYLLNEDYSSDNDIPCVKEVRGKGLMIGIDIEETSKFATAGEVQKMCLAAAENGTGLCISTAGVKTLRFLPPLVITKAEVDTGLEILKEILS